MADFIAIDPSLPVPIYWQIAEGFRQCIARGEMLPGDPLPSLRALASRLGVSVSTVAKAYDLLSAEGLVATRKGKGSVLSTAGRPPRDADLQHLDECLLQAIWVSESLGMSGDDLVRRLVAILESRQTQSGGPFGDRS